MNWTPPVQSMTESSARYDNYPIQYPTRPNYNYPQIPTIQRPPIAHHGYSRSYPPGRSVTENTYAKNSVSSATSGSTAGSEPQKHPSMNAYKYGAQAENGYMEDINTRHSYGGPHTHTRHPTNGSSYAPTEMVEDNSAVFRYIQQQDIIEEDEVEKDHAVWILMWLSFIDPLHSLFSSFFTLFVLVFLIITSPIRLCQKQSSFSTSFIRIVAPVFRNHLQMIYASSVERAHTFDFSPFSLFLVHVASPLLSVGVAVASWISAVFWIFAITMGNPDGTEKRDDGRATVLMVRNWWEKYLLNAIRQ